MTKSYKNIKSWAEQERPREKLKEKGVRALTDSEVLALIVGNGTKEMSVVELCRIILADSNNSFDELAKKDLHDLTKLKGVGEAKAISIMAALEIGRRRKLQETKEKTFIKDSKVVFELFYSDLADLPHEEFWVAFTNRSNKLIEKMKISQGGIAGTVLDVRIIMKKALDVYASSIILCHNHPSGNLNASQDDIDVTKRIKAAAAMFDITVLDHIIIGDSRYMSFADEGLI
ncbi:MAG: DNA repair protein RadC [Bacteroidales bacterium]|nr:DNA repair protein RadC [Bacteroidales bacterium]